VRRSGRRDSEFDPQGVIQVEPVVGALQKELAQVPIAFRYYECEQCPSSTFSKEENMASTDWLEEAYELDKEGKVHAALDVIYNKIDDMMWAGDKEKDWSDIDEVLEAVDFDRVSPTMLVGFLTITLPFPVRASLKSRAAFYDKTVAVLGDRADAVLKGLK